MALMGITILVASILEVGQAFHESRTPVASYRKFINLTLSYLDLLRYLQKTLELYFSERISQTQKQHKKQHKRKLLQVQDGD